MVRRIVRPRPAGESSSLRRRGLPRRHSAMSSPQPPPASSRSRKSALLLGLIAAGLAACCLGAGAAGTFAWLSWSRGPAKGPSADKLPDIARLPGIVAYWPFDEGLGPVAYDAITKQPGAL